MTEPRYVALEELFSPGKGQSRYTRSYGESHPGPHPIYSASLNGPLTHADSYDLEGTFLTYTVNGYAGFVQIKSGKFSVNADRAVLLAKEDVVLPNLHYLAHVIEPVIRPLAIGRIVDGKNEYTKVQWAKIKDSEIPLLVGADEALDYDAMEQVGERIRLAEQLQDDLVERATQIDESSVLVTCEEPFTDISLGDTELFRLSIGKRVLINETTDTGVPVYSANTRGTFGRGFVATKTLIDTTCDSLIWGIDEELNWNLIIRGSDFVPTDHCGRAEVLHSNLDAEYLLHELRATAEEHGFDRVYRANLENVKSIGMRIPTDSGGNFDLGRQRELAERYKTVEALKEKVIDSINAVTARRLVLA
jgi:hypothetical protein